MAGRGRGMTLPAWMTANGAPPGGQPPAAAGNPVSPIRAPGGPGGPPQAQFQRPPGAPPPGFAGAGGFPGAGFAPGAPPTRPPGQTQPPGQAQFPPGTRPPGAPGTFPPTGQFGQPPTGAPTRPAGFGSPPQARPSGPPPGNFQFAPRPGFGPPGSAPPGGPPGQTGFTQAPRPFTGMPPGAPPGAFPPPAGATAAPAAGVRPAGAPPPAAPNAAAVWSEHTNNGRTYYYNRMTKQSTYEKPLELMTPDELKNPFNLWKEHTNADGRTYYFNKVTKLSTWTLPEDLKAAKEAKAAATAAAATVAGPPLVAGPVPTAAPVFRPPFALSPSPGMLPYVASPVTPILAASPVAVSPAPMLSTPERAGNGAAANGRPTAEDLEEAKRAQPAMSKINTTPAEEVKPTPKNELLTFANKQDAKNAFKEMLDSHKIGLDWTWEQAMKKIINDKRYGALKTLGEKKQAFNEYQTQKKKAEKEEQRLRQKKAREDYLTMLQQSTLLSATTRWSKAVPMFENDPRFKALEDDREREDMFEDYLLDLEKKEKEGKKKERKKNMDAFKQFLETCDFIKSTTQWRKVADKLEEDESATKLERVDKMDVFTDYIRDLEKKEEEAKQLEKDKKRRQERKNRDAFRDQMNEHKAAGELSAKTKWKDYLETVKETPAYAAVAGNAAGSTPKELFEDLIEELTTQLRDEKAKVKDALKDGTVALKVTVATEFDDFQAAIAQAGDLAAISETNIKLIFKDLVERAKEKDEKENKKRKRLEEDFVEALRATRAVYVDSTWAELKPLVEKDAAYKAIEEPDRVRVFEEYLARQKAKAEEKEKRHREKDDKDKSHKHDRDKDREKGRREKDRSGRDKEHRGREKEREAVPPTDEDYKMDDADPPPEKDRESEERRREKRHKKRHRSVSPEPDEGGERERKHRHKSRDEKKSSRKHGLENESDEEGRHKRHRSKHGDGGGRAEVGERNREDGEVDSEDGEIR